MRVRWYSDHCLALLKIYKQSRPLSFWARLWYHGCGIPLVLISCCPWCVCTMSYKRRDTLCYFLSSRMKQRLFGLVWDSITLGFHHLRQNGDGCCVYRFSEGGLLFRSYSGKVSNFDKFKPKLPCCIANIEMVRLKRDATD